MEQLTSRERYLWKIILLEIRGQELKLHSCLADSNLQGIDDRLRLTVPKGFRFQKEVIEGKKRVILDIAGSVFEREFYDLICIEEL